MQIYTALLKIYIELKENRRKPPNKNHLSICQEKQPSPKDNFKPRGKSTMNVDQHFRCMQSKSLQEKDIDRSKPEEYIYTRTSVTTYSTPQHSKLKNSSSDRKRTL